MLPYVQLTSVAIKDNENTLETFKIKMSAVHKTWYHFLQGIN